MAVPESQWTMEAWRKSLREVVRRATTDPHFRKLTLKDAAAAMKEVSGMDLPSGAHLRFVEKQKETVIKLPPLLSRDEVLTSKALDQVAGSFYTWCRDVALKTKCSWC
jgi:hypothetical protein